MPNPTPKVLLLLICAALLVGCLTNNESNNETNNVIVIDDVNSASSNNTTPNNVVSNNTTPNNATTGNGCVDADGDGWAVNCDDFTGVDGPDCDDADANVWTACDTCSDSDGDGWFGACDVYDGVDGPDCDDANADTWMSCDTCVDEDSDGHFVGCDAYSMAEDCDDSSSDVNPSADEVQGNGVDDDCDAGTTDACEYSPVPATDPEPGVLAGITAAHNYWRWRVGLQPLTWNSDLAASATDYAERCVWRHDDGRSPDAGFSSVGENLYASSQSPSSAVILDSVQQWADERYDFDFGFTTGQTTGGAVGHYTQIVWADSREVGCGYADCNSIQGISFGGTVVVCRYGPTGNYLGQAPYDFKEGACLDLDNDDQWQVMDPDDTDRSL